MHSLWLTGGVMPRDVGTYDPVVGGGWAGLARAILHTSGPMSLLAFMMVLFLAWAVWGRLDHLDASDNEIKKQLVEANAQMRAFVTGHDQVERERATLLHSQVIILRQLCVNSARTQEQTRGCVSE